MIKKYLLSNKNIAVIKKKIINKTIILFLDYDGTLAPFTDNPEKAVPFSGIEQILQELSQKQNIFINIVSGRTLSSLNKLIDISGINYIGTHGLEIKIDEKYFQFEPDSGINIIKNKKNYILDSGKSISKSEQKTMPKIRSYFKYLKNNHKGIKYEDKTHTLALHYPPSYQIDSIINYLKKTIDHDQLEILQGRNVIEIRPSGWNKGKAVKYILKNIFPDKLNKYDDNSLMTIYIGDDTTDEDAFKELSGLNIYVKNEDNLDTAADYYLNDPGDVYTFLEIINKIL